MRLILTIDDKKYGHIAPGEIRAYVHLALKSYGGGYHSGNELFDGLKVGINILDDDVYVMVNGETGEIISGVNHLTVDALTALEKKVGKQRGN